MKQTGYFDWAATSVPDEEILREALDLSLAAFGNPSSAHRAGNEARELLERSRERCAAALGVQPQNLIFTAGGTEANHLPILSLLQRPASGSIVISAIEHPAVREQAQMMKHCGWTVIPVLSDNDGIVRPQALLRKLRDDTALVCVMAVNNETGAIQPVAEIAQALITHAGNKKKPLFHVDAVQAAGKIPLDLACAGIDSAAISAHKIGGPRGTGLLYYARRQEPFVRGGEQEAGLRPGTENVFGAVALAACLEKYAEKNKVAINNAEAEKLMRLFIAGLQKIDGCKIIPRCRADLQNNRAPEEVLRQEYSPWILQVSFEAIPGNVLVRALSEKGFYISTGSACSARKTNRPVLEAMQVPKEEAATAVRFSFGRTTDESEIEALVGALKEIKTLFYYKKG